MLGQNREILKKQNKEIYSWIMELVESSKFNVKDITFEEANEWVYDSGIIHHLTNRFFNVVAVSFTYPDGTYVKVPLFEQREIGTLGYIIRNRDNTNELLIHAKLEPGNIGPIQIAPTCQATESNADRVHGGDSSPFADLFDNNEVDIISSTLQSEQGTRFLHKQNSNVLAKLKPKSKSQSKIHKWVPIDDIFNLLDIDYLFNSDSRSVLVCSNWEELLNREPFSKKDIFIAKKLNKSYKCDGLYETTEDLKERLTKMRNKISSPKIIPLEELDDYEITPEALVPINDGPFKIKFIKVTTRYREVSSWNQPIIESLGTGNIDLIVSMYKGTLYFLLKPIIEPGLINRVELGPSITIEPGEKQPKITYPDNYKVLVQSWQTDEGGRFFRDKSLYRILDAGELYEVPKDWTWLTLKQLKSLIDEGGWVTNETRSVLSLVMKWI